MLKSIFILLFTIIPLLLFSQKSDKDIDILLENIDENLRNDFTKAKPLIDSGFVLCKETDDTVNLFYLTNKLGVFYHLKEEVDSAKKYYTQLINGLEEVKPNNRNKNILSLLYSTYSNLGMLSRNKLDNSNTKKYYLKAEKLAFELNNIEKIVGSKIQLSNLYQREDDYTRSMVQLFDCLNMMDSLNDDMYEIKSSVYSTLGANFYRIDDFDNAKKYFLKAIKCDKKGNDLFQEIINKENYLHIIWETDGVQKVDTLLNEYINLCKSSDIPFHVLRSQIILGDYFLEKQELDSALYYFESTLPSIKKKAIVDLYQELYLLGGRVYTEMGLDNTATKMFELSLQYPQSIDQSFLGYESLYTLSKKSNNSKKSLYYLEKLTALKDSIEILDQRKFAKKLELEYNVKEKELKNSFLAKELETEKKLKADEEHEKLVFMLLFFATAISMGFTVFFALRLKKNKSQTERINKELRKLNKSLDLSNKALEDEVNIRTELISDYFKHANQKIYMARPDKKREWVKCNDIVYIKKNNPSEKKISFYIDYRKEVYSKSESNILKVKAELYKKVFCQIDKYLLINLHYIKSVDLNKREVTLFIHNFRQSTNNKPTLQEVKCTIGTEYLDDFKQQIEVYKGDFIQSEV